MNRPLTPREHEVLAAYCRLGMYKAVGQELHISSRTVRNHLRCVHRKAGTANTLQAALLGLREGWLSWDEVAA